MSLEMGGPGPGDVAPRGRISTMRRLARSAPRSAGVAGIAFSAMFIASMLAVSQRSPDRPDEAGWLTALLALWPTTLRRPLPIRPHRPGVRPAAAA